MRLEQEFNINIDLKGFQIRLACSNLIIQGFAMSTLKTFQVNDMVFINNVGYGTLIDIGNSKFIPVIQAPVSIEKRQSIYFDPELFNSDPESLTKQKSQPTSLLVDSNKLEQNKVAEQKKVSDPPNPSDTAKQQNNTSKPIEDTVKQQIKEDKINIVKVRLEGTTALVYTSQQNIRKYVILPVRPLFAPALGTINIKIDIGKTIQSFKREIFDLLGLKHSHYFNVKLFTTNPILTQLNSTGKTIWQYGLRESSILTMIAEHGFIFQSIPAQYKQYFSQANNNLTLTSLPKKPKVVQNVVIALPPPAVTTAVTTTVSTAVSTGTQSQVPSVPSTQSTNQTQNNNSKNEVKTEQKKDEQTKAQQTKVVVQAKKQEIVKQEKQPQIPQILFINGDKYLKTGKQYFEVKIDKVPQKNNHLVIGVRADNGARLWTYEPLSQLKVYKQNNEIKISEGYGMSIKQNDIIGVFVKIDKQKNMKLTFFKNNINLGSCFEAKIDEISFFFGIGSEGQISLDTRAQVPIDSYRFR